jgi:flagellar hook-basal body complex protein FliE
MTDPLGLISNSTTMRGVLHTGSPREGSPEASEGAAAGPAFSDLLRSEIDQVNRLQRDASAAVEDLYAGRRDDVESVMIATQKADTAFRMLLAVRNKVMEAYDEVKQLRV